MLRLLVSATIAIHAEVSTGVALDKTIEIETLLGRAIEAQTGALVIVEDPAWGPCAIARECVEGIESTTRATSIVLVRAFEALRFIRVRIERSDKASSGELDLPKSAPETWRGLLDGLVVKMFSEGRALAEVRVPIGDEQGAELKPKHPWLALAGMGAGVVLLGTALAFGASSASAHAAIEGGVLRANEYSDESSRLRAHGLAANLLGVASIVALTGSMLLLAAW
ncbi:MAG: hypothetical protein HYV07_23060 [Deltaproteobacteria bacterium]|nr:hypothetical protein [Deltaproteobacteria bacterium]